MGALPFRRISKTRKRLRRTHMVKEVPGMTTCPKCGEAIKPHRACTKCGNYKGKEVIKTDKTEE